MGELKELYTGCKTTFYDKGINEECKKRLRFDGKLLYKD